MRSAGRLLLPGVGLAAAAALVHTLVADAPAQLAGDVWPAAAVFGAAWLPIAAIAALPLRWPALTGGAGALLLAAPLAVWAEGALAGYGGSWWALVAALAWGAACAWATTRSWWAPGGLTAGAAALGVAAALGSATAALPGAAAPAGPAARGPTLVLLTLDTFRADHLARIGGPGARYRVPTPHLDALIDRGALFTEGVAPAALTGPSHAGILTGTNPLDLPVLRNGDPLPADAAAVAAALAERGYRTGAFIGAAVLDRRVAMDRGFQHYDDRFDALHRVRHLPPFPQLAAFGAMPRHAQRPGGEVVARAQRWLAEDPGAATFVWVHLYDAHAPYDPEPDARGRLTEAGPPVGDPADVRAWVEWRRERLQLRPMLGLSGARRDVATAVADYAAEIAEVDDLVGRLVAALPPDARIVVTADHGESLTEQGYILNHGRHAFQSTLRVPVIAVGPGFPAGAIVDHPVPNWLSGGTLAAWGGAPRVGLADALRGWAAPIESYAAGQEARPAFVLGPRDPELTVREGAVKWWFAGERRWRFDLAADPSERAPADAELGAYDAAYDPRYDALRQEPADPTPAWLEALGYVDP